MWSVLSRIDPLKQAVGFEEKERVSEQIAEYRQWPSEPDHSARSFVNWATPWLAHWSPIPAIPVAPNQIITSKLFQRRGEERRGEGRAYRAGR